MAGARVLVVDDDPAILRVVRRSLEAQGYDVRGAADGHNGLGEVERFSPEVILLDLVLPDTDGIGFCARIRPSSQAHVIVLSAVGDDRKKIEALEAGADDYVVKPFSMGELEARIRVGLRRRANLAASTVLRANGVELDVASHQVAVGGKPVHLTPKEFELLRLLLENQGRVVTQHFLLGRVWGPEYVDDAHVLRTFVHQLRSKLGALDPAAAAMIMTDPGVGYRVTPES